MIRNRQSTAPVKVVALAHDFGLKVYQSSDILANPIFQAFRKQCALPAIHPLNKALHPIPPQIAQQS
jgi:hypothetical protein